MFFLLYNLHFSTVLYVIYVSFKHQVDESNKHAEDDEEFNKEDEIMCNALENIS